MIYLELFLNFLKIGAFTIGGGMAMIPLIGNVLISKNWITNELFINFIAIAESTPGPFAINIATFVGYNIGGFFGAFVCVLGLFLPSFIIILLIFKFFDRFMKNTHIKNAFNALRPAVIGLIACAFVSIGYNSFFSEKVGIESLIGVIMTIIIISLMQIKKLKKIHPIFFILMSAGLGILIYGVIL